ncbi:MAG: hypothetical protein FGM14_16180 [Flavobacteriales bacterium]|nr:hypothetical protein [Flavobacteriales bacterium]
MKSILLKFIIMIFVTNSCSHQLSLSRKTLKHQVKSINPIELKKSKTKSYIYSLHYLRKSILKSKEFEIKSINFILESFNVENGDLSILFSTNDNDYFFSSSIFSKNTYNNDSNLDLKYWSKLVKNKQYELLKSDSLTLSSTYYILTTFKNAKITKQFFWQ